MSFGEIYYSARIPFDGKLIIYFLTIFLFLLTINSISYTMSLNSEKEKLDKEEEGSSSFNTIQNNIHFYSLLQSINLIGSTIQLIGLLIVIIYIFGIK
jgi:hypothetical protein